MKCSSFNPYFTGPISKTSDLTLINKRKISFNPYFTGPISKTEYTIFNEETHDLFQSLFHAFSLKMMPLFLSEKEGTGSISKTQ